MVEPNLEGNLKKVIFGANPETPWDKIKINSKTYVMMGVLGGVFTLALLYWQYLLIMLLVAGIIYLRVKKRKEGSS